MIDTHFPQTSE